MPLLGAVTGGAPPTKVKVPDLTPTACSQEGTLWGGGGFILSHSAVGGSIPSIIFQTKCTSVWRCILLGADNEIRVFEPLAITGL